MAEEPKFFRNGSNQFDARRAVTPAPDGAAGIAIRAYSPGEFRAIRDGRTEDRGVRRQGLMPEKAALCGPLIWMCADRCARH